MVQAMVSVMVQAMAPGLAPVVDKAAPRSVEPLDSFSATMLEAGTGGKEAPRFRLVQIPGIGFSLSVKGAALGFWGKIIGGAVGFAMGGPVGAVLGSALGHAADEGSLGNGLPNLGIPGMDGARIAAMLGSRESLFAISVVVLSAKLAKCDGPVKRVEIDAFKQMFRIPPENMREVAQLFDQARDSAEGAEPYAERLGAAFAEERNVLEDVLGALFRIAEVDGPANRAELAFLGAIHAKLRLDGAAWERARLGRPNPSSPALAPEGPDPYAVLGLGREATDQQVRETWKRLMREHHPDSMTARGLPAELVRRATGKVADINAAWDRIKRERGI
jgi:DnaJ like chaperone protein